MCDEPSPEDLRPSSWLISGGRSRRPGAPLNAPIITASNFELGAEDVYAREDGTATVRALEELLCGLEAPGLEGAGAVAFGSGMAAVAAVLSRLGQGAHLVLPDDCYYGVGVLAEEGKSKFGWRVDRLPSTATERWIDRVAVADLVWLESPTNPLLEVADVPAVCAAERGRGQSGAGTLVCVDSTFATPMLQRPLLAGADIVMHSTTKYLGGHSDLLGGALIARAPGTLESLRAVRGQTGASPGALETFLALRGCRTLALRMERAQSNARKLAERLAAHPRVQITRYPGLESHPTHEVARRTLEGFGAIISFDPAGSGDDADRMIRALRLIRHATSLGGVESTIERRAVLEGQKHLPPTLLRLSVGCEDLEDLWTDLERGLALLR